MDAMVDPSQRWGNGKIKYSHDDDKTSYVLFQHALSIDLIDEMLIHHLAKADKLQPLRRFLEKVQCDSSDRQHPAKSEGRPSRAESPLSADRSKKGSKSSSLASEDRVMAVAADVRDVLLELFAEDTQGVRFAKEFPTLVYFSPDESLGMLRTVFPNLDDAILVNVSVALSKRGLKDSSRSDILDADVSLGGFKVGRSCTTSSVKESIGGVLTAEPASLGVQMAWRAHLPEGWTITRYLGSGKTSNVYEADRGGGNGCVALKVFKRGYAEHGDDARYLNELQGVDGVPRVIECSTEGSMLVMEPAGEAFEASAIGQDLPLADLVDVLQNAHVLNIVNRDVCQENIMVAKSLKTGKLRMFIHDWGFAEKSDCKSGHFCRSILSAFGDMLQQYMQGARYLVYKLVDDLISLVRCIFLVLNPLAATKKAALEAATNVDYIALKATFKIIEDVTQDMDFVIGGKGVVHLPFVSSSFVTSLA
ncbi:hypothetical protein GOP47_0026313 [Adiantum capillus-veneris]|nr:hypothetical protein GOP47_0026313 [Adiantum capillus-veneris]